MRNGPTPAERALWQELKNSKSGYKFSRQIRRGSYICDFCCRSRKLIVEVDGEVHLHRIEEDKERTKALEEKGYVVLRFKNDDVLCRVSQVVEAIQHACEGRPQWRY